MSGYIFYEISLKVGIVAKYFKDVIYKLIYLNFIR